MMMSKCKGTITNYFIVLIAGGLIGFASLKLYQHLQFEMPLPVASLPDGARYEGELRNGVMHGEGRLLWENGDHYEGVFKDGLFHGHGRYRQKEGYVYEGQFKQGRMTGHGTLTISDEQTYTGQLKNSRFEGKGTFYSYGDEYEGEFSNNLYHGYGVLKSKDGYTYSGEFKKGVFYGQGSYETQNKQTYEGQFIDAVFTGKGRYSDEEGNQYEGEFKNWVYNGEGVLTDKEGNQYKGHFEDGYLNQEGEYIGEDSSYYKGGFKYGQYHGKGKLMTADGDVYDGSFDYGQYHGEGTLVYALPQDGVTAVEGTWRYGKLIKSKDGEFNADENVITETVLYNQNELLASSWATLLNNDPNQIELYFLGIAGDGSQEVFRREIKYVQQYFDQNYQTENKSIALINSKNTYKETPLATKTSVQKSLNEIAKRMDVENDILFIYMTSHGSKEFEFHLGQNGLSIEGLAAKDFAFMLKNSPVRWKVVVISACFSGGFIPELEDEYTLVITAAAADRKSFGCDDKNDFTYFGEAFFKQALPESKDFAEAFEKAEAIVRQREDEQDYKNSNPQIHKPEKVLTQLQQWRMTLAP